MDFANHFRQTRRLALAAAVVLGTTVSSGLGTTHADAAAKVTAAKVGGVCKTAGAVSGQLVCTKKASRLVWAKAATATSPVSAPAPSAGPASIPPTTPTAAPVSSSVIAGSWNAAADSVIGYRVKEVLEGQSVEAYGRTNAISGTLVIEGTSAKSLSLVVDVTKLESDQAQRDKAVQERILETRKYPTAKLTLKAPTTFGKIPADKEVLSLKATVSLTIKAVTRDIEVALKTRRVGTTVEVTGSIPVLWSDWGIENPSFPPLVTTEDNGILEFLVIFSR
jgi:polyisoprenoid-binding protein YceI